jgi:hypothetical protein
VMRVHNHPLGFLVVNGRLVTRDCQHARVGAGISDRIVDRHIHKFVIGWP